jgi:hypothetical protein
MREVNVLAGRARSSGNASANVWRIARAEERIASARDEPIVAVIQGARTSSLKGCPNVRLRIHARTLVSHGSPVSTACRASCVKAAKSTARDRVESGVAEEKTGGPPPIGKTHRLPVDSTVSPAPGCSGS